jgi:hypothetical protein
VVAFQHAREETGHFWLTLLVENPWAIVVLLAIAATGLVFALVIRRFNRGEPPSLFVSKRE